MIGIIVVFLIIASALFIAVPIKAERARLRITQEEFDQLKITHKKYEVRPMSGFFRGEPDDYE